MTLIDVLNHPAAGPMLVTFLGLIWGSFFNVCIYRMPQDESVVTGSSHCPHCGKSIPWYQNIPIFSYIFLNGVSGCCKKPISIQYPLVEGFTALSFLSLYYYFGVSPQFVCYAVLFSGLIVLSVIDLHHRIIPDEISLGGIPVGIAATFWHGDISWVNSVAGVLLGGGIFWAIAYGYERFSGREGLGGGDIKLLGMLGAWFGASAIPIVILISTSLGSIVGVAWMLLRRKNWQAAIPFGPFLAIAAVAYLFGRPCWEGWFYPP